MHKYALSLFAILITAVLGATSYAEPNVAAGKEKYVSTDDPHTHLQEILQRPLYQRWKLRQERALSQPSYFGDLMDSLAKKVKNAIRSIFKAIEEFFRHYSPNRLDLDLKSFSILGLLEFGGWITIAILAIFIVYFASKAFFLKQARNRFSRVLSREQVREALESGEALALDSPQWLDEAENMAKEKDFRGMYRAIYLALLSGLHKSKKIDFRTNRTNWTYVSTFRGPENDRNIFSSLTSLFDDVWYGLKQADGESISGVKKQVSSLLGTNMAHE